MKKLTKKIYDAIEADLEFFLIICVPLMGIFSICIALGIILIFQ